MKSVKVLMTIALCGSTLSPIMATSAIAAIDPIYGNLDSELDEACDALLNPADNSGFVTFAWEINSHTSPTSTVDDGIISTVGIGTPTQTIGNYTDAHVNGQSVNIHAYGDKVTTYPGRLVTYRTKITTVTTTTGKCHVHKETKGANQEDIHPGYMIAPGGLQGEDEVSRTSTEITYGTRTETISGSWVDPNTSEYGAEFVICISPSKPPPKGTWRGQNGYTNQLGQVCSTAWHDSLGLSQPTASLPPY